MRNLKNITIFLGLFLATTVVLADKYIPYAANVQSGELSIYLGLEGGIGSVICISKNKDEIESDKKDEFDAYILKVSEGSEFLFSIFINQIGCRDITLNTFRAFLMGLENNSLCQSEIAKYRETLVQIEENFNDLTPNEIKELKNIGQSSVFKSCR